MNGGKTQLIPLKQGPSKVSDLTFFGSQLTEAQSVKILGVTLGKTNQFSQHCLDRAAAANRRIGLLKMLRGKDWGANRKSFCVSTSNMSGLFSNMVLFASEAKTETLLNI